MYLLLSYPHSKKNGLIFSLDHSIIFSQIFTSLRYNFILYFSIPLTVRTTILKAIELLQEETCIKFEEAGGRTLNKVLFTNDSRCWSYLGMVGGTQNVSMANTECVLVSHLIFCLAFLSLSRCS